ncbi:unnamed protein product [Bursaphelenchus okinawaensis]|uniref:Uncharacterized protein n=1 Tax=Bursaphelenchus okinawaensis TaxID=465554 RepID=A0A811JW47_9BILA|nr:unnamed protein product [Bursaphelenchus okinawaensis]CAG9086498.1 unnamed protein product [Bursaphelenchus okinawaensis]
MHRRRAQKPGQADQTEDSEDDDAPEKATKYFINEKDGLKGYTPDEYQIKMRQQAAKYQSAHQNQDEHVKAPDAKYRKRHWAKRFFRKKQKPKSDIPKPTRHIKSTKPARRSSADASTSPIEKTAHQESQNSPVEASSSHNDKSPIVS